MAEESKPADPEPVHDQPNEAIRSRSSKVIRYVVAGSLSVLLYIGVVGLIRTKTGPAYKRDTDEPLYLGLTVVGFFGALAAWPWPTAAEQEHRRLKRQLGELERAEKVRKESESMRAALAEKWKEPESAKQPARPAAATAIEAELQAALDRVMPASATLALASGWRIDRRKFDVACSELAGEGLEHGLCRVIMFGLCREAAERDEVLDQVSLANIVALEMAARFPMVKVDHHLGVARRALTVAQMCGMMRVKPARNGWTAVADHTRFKEAIRLLQSHGAEATQSEALVFAIMLAAQQAALENSASLTVGQLVAWAVASLVNHAVEHEGAATPSEDQMRQMLEFMRRAFEVAIEAGLISRTPLQASE